VVDALKMKVRSSLLEPLHQSGRPGLPRNRRAPNHRARKQTSHGCMTNTAKNVEMFVPNSKVRGTERRDGQTLLKDKGLRELLDQTSCNDPSFPMVEGMEVDQLGVTVELHIVQDPAGMVATPVELEKDRVSRVGSLSAMSVVGRAS
jgi:hypothetical protein